MNERIRELWSQSVQPHTGDSWAEQTEFMERFAQLIVKETLQVARAGIEYGDGMETAVYRYFGVEE